MRDGAWKLVRPAIDISYATAEDRELAARYVGQDIEYKYHPENVTQIFNWPEPGRVIPDPPPPELYNIEDDPQEKADLADLHPGRVSRMLGELEAWFEEVESERRRIRDVERR